MSLSSRTPSFSDFFLMVLLVLFNIYAKYSSINILKSISREVIIVLLLLKVFQNKLNDALSLNFFVFLVLQPSFVNRLKCVYLCVCVYTHTNIKWLVKKTPEKVNKYLSSQSFSFIKERFICSTDFGGQEIFSHRWDFLSEFGIS